MFELAELRIHDAAPVGTAADVVRRTATEVGVLASDADALAQTAVELVEQARAREWFGEQPDPVSVRVMIRGPRLQLEVRDTRMPVPAEPITPAVPGPVTVHRDFSGGNVVRCGMPLVADLAWLAGETRIPPDAQVVGEAVADAVVFRAATPEDAKGIIRLTYRCYGYSHPLMGDPDSVARELASGRMISQVAVSGSEVIGHVALVGDGGDGIPELGRLIVDPRFRSHHVAERLVADIVPRGAAAGLSAAWGEAVVNHPFSQRVVTEIGGVAVGALLDAIPPLTMAGMPDASQHRQTLLPMIVPLNGSPAGAAFLPEHLHEVYLDVTERLGLVRTVTDNDRVAHGHTQIRVTANPVAGNVRVEVLRVGADGVEVVLDALAAANAEHAAVRYLDISLSDPCAPYSVRTAEKYGYSWAALLPDDGRAGDVLRMQYIGQIAPDLSDARCATEHGHQMLEFALAEHRRVMRVASRDEGGE